MIKKLLTIGARADWAPRFDDWHLIMSPEDPLKAKSLDLGLNTAGCGPPEKLKYKQQQKNEAFKI